MRGADVREVAHGPGRVLLHDGHHAVDDGLPLGAVGQRLHLLEQAVDLGVLVVGRVLAVVLGLARGAVQQEQEVLGVGVVGQPAQPEHLVLALAHLVLELVVVGGAHLQLYVDLGELPHHPVELGLVARRGRRVVVVVQHQRAAGLRVAAVRVAGLGHELLRVGDGPARGAAVLPDVRHRVEAALRALAAAEDARRHRAHRGVAGVLGEDAAVLLPVDGDAQRLAQLAVALALRGVELPGLAVAELRVEHVEAQVPAVDVGAALEPEALVQVLAAHALAVLHVHQVGQAGVGALEHLDVVVALAELAALRHGLALHGGHEGVDEGRGLAAVVEQARLLVPGHALAGVGLAAVVGVALQHVAAVLLVGHQHVGARAHRPRVQRQPALGHAGLGVEGVGLPGHGGQEGHLHPVAPLRILALDADAQQVLLGRAGTRQRPAPEVEEGLVQAGRVQALAQLGVLGLDERAVLLQPQHVLGEGAVDGRRDARGGVALDGVDEVLGHQLARALVLEVPGRAARAQLAGLHRVVAVAALLVRREGRVRLEADARLDGHVVDALHHLLGGRVLGQHLAVLADVARRHHRRRRLGHQLEGALQVVVAVGRLVDLVGEGGLVVPIRGRGVQVARRALDDGGEQRVALGVARGPGVVVATRSQHRRQDGGHWADRAEEPHGSRGF